MIYVMSDIHGMYEKYIQMLKVIGLTERDTLYILGDVIDRGPGSVKILLDMKKRPNVRGIFGNHEWMLMENLDWLSTEITEDSLQRLNERQWLKFSEWVSNGALTTLQEWRTLSLTQRQELRDYLLHFSAYEDLRVNGQRFWLVHAGLGHFHPDKTLADYDVEDLIWRRPDWQSAYFDEAQRYVVVGHTPTLAINGKAEIFHHHDLIAIDCGACFASGALSCLCLDTLQEFYV